MVLGEPDGENGSSNAPPAPSQRITPYLAKVAALRPTSAAKPHTPQSSGKFAERQNAGGVVASLNAHLEVPAEEPAGGEAEAMDVDGGAAAVAAGSGSGSGRVEVEVLGQPLGAGAKYMVDRLEDKVRRWECGRALGTGRVRCGALGTGRVRCGIVVVIDDLQWSEGPAGASMLLLWCVGK